MALSALPGRARARGRVGTLLEVGGLAALAYLPFLLSRRGRLSADTKAYLYLDPGGLLERAPSLWDPSIGAGTVPHQQIGYLFPMGPWFWALDAVGLPDWVAQRLWLGTISFAAALGARWLLGLLGTGRAGALAGALVYALTPYQLAFTSGLSVLLLPWAGLPWLVGLTVRAVRRGGWRDPALFALVVLCVGGVNASALLLAGLAPALWLLGELVRGPGTRRRRVLAATGRLALLSLGVSVWWIVGLRLQGAYGLPILELTESLAVVAESSAPDEVLRGLGNWLLDGEDAFGSIIEQAAGYREGGWVGAATVALPAGALAAAVLLRWRHRAYAAALVVVGTVVAVGSWPFDERTPWGDLWHAFTGTAAGLALRNSPRAVPVVVLGVALLLAAAVGALRTRALQVGAAAVVGGLALAALGPVWETGFLTGRLDRPERVPGYWREAAAAMDEGGDATRVLELPGTNFTAYTWGTTVDPVTTGLAERPSLSREVLPNGSPESVDLLDALDGRIQQGSFEPASLAPVARLFGAGTVALRNDLDTARYGLPDPSHLWRALTSPLAPGLAEPRGFGPPAGEEPDPGPSVALLDVEDEVPVVRTAPPSQPLVLEGDGEGVVDAAAAGLVDGRALLLSAAALDDGALARALDAGADLVVTDTNRRQVEHWFFGVDANKGPTELPGIRTPDPFGYDHRLDVFPGTGDDARTVAVQRGGRVVATQDGGPGRPEDKAVAAVDGDLRTTWRIGGEDPTGERLTLTPDEPVRADRVVLVQPQEGPRDRVLTRVRLRFDEGEDVVAELGPESFDPAGQEVRFEPRDVGRLEIELLETTDPPMEARRANAVGFAEVRLADVRVVEGARLPTELLARAGDGAAGHRLDLVLTRLRRDPAQRGRLDEELRLDRRFDLPGPRTFRVSGTARVNPNAPDAVLDRALGTTAEGATFDASSHLTGDLGARASRAFDGDPTTAWVPAAGPQAGAALEVRLATPVTVGGFDLTVLGDGVRALPTRLRLEVDGEARELDVPEVADEGTSTVRVDVPGAAPAGRDLRLEVLEVRAPPPPEGEAPPEPPPVGVAEVAVAGVPEPAPPGAFGGGCRRDLVTVDGSPVPVRVVGAALDARRGLAVEGCGPLDLSEGAHTLASAQGLDDGIDVDRLVLGSDAGGGPAPVAARGTPRSQVGSSVEVRGSGRTSMDLEVETDGEPFWLVLGQSRNDGWRIDAGAAEVGPLRLADGYANGWLVTPDGPGTLAVRLDWRPQRLVWGGLAVSAVAVLACLAIVAAPLLRRRWPARLRPAADEHPALGPLVPRGAGASWAASVASGLGVAAVTDLVSRPWIAAVAGLAAAAAARLPVLRVPVGVGAPVALVAARLTETPELAWLALALLAAALVAGARWPRRRAGSPPGRPEAEAAGPAAPAAPGAPGGPGALGGPAAPAAPPSVPA